MIMISTQLLLHILYVIHLKLNKKVTNYTTKKEHLIKTYMQIISGPHYYLKHTGIELLNRHTDMFTNFLDVGSHVLIPVRQPNSLQLKNAMASGPNTPMVSTTMKW